MPSPTPATGQVNFARVGFAGAATRGRLMPGSLRAWAAAPLAGPGILRYGPAARQAIAIKSPLKEAQE